jgi:hypothetical protein
LRERVPQEAGVLGFIEGVLAERARETVPRTQSCLQRLRE